MFGRNGIWVVKLLSLIEFIRNVPKPAIGGQEEKTYSITK